MTQPYSNIYNNEHFRRGFNLIESQSNEKLTIATFLTEIIQGLLKQKKHLEILDLAGGSGSIWGVISILLNNNGILAKKKISLSLVDSSAEQIAKAKNLNLPCLKTIKADATQYLKGYKESFDLITCIHFFPGLTKEKQEEVFEDCQKALNKGGIWVGVQPDKGNPLTYAKIALKKAIFNINYQPSYTVPKSVKRRTIPSYLKVQQTQLADLAYFLLGKYAVGKEINNIIRDVFKKIITEQGKELEIALLNDYLVFKKK